MDIVRSFAVLLLLATRAFGKPSTSANSFASDAHKFNTTTVFTRIVPSNDLSHHNAIYITPELLFLGKSNGDILRCLFKDPSVCEMFYSYSSSTGVTSTVISGEYLYASLANGAMLRCYLYQKQCTTFNNFGNPMNALAVSAGYIHAGLNDGRMLRCDLDQPNKCTTLNQLQGKITSIGATHEYIYAGLDSAQVWRCSMSSENSCRMIHMAGSKIIQGMAAVEDTVISISQGGISWNCTRGQNCSSTNVPQSDYTSMAVFDRSLYVMRNSNISICLWGTGSTARNCAPYEHHERGISISFAYSTYKMQDRFVNEEKTCLSGALCPPFMVYYKVNERSMLEVFVKHGKLYNSEGVLVDTRNADMAHSGRAAIFAMGADGQILLSKARHGSVLRTSSLFAGHPVAGAGEMVVDDGIIKSIRACSDHYRPTVELNQQVINALYLKGYTDKIDNLPCCRGNECGRVDVEENTVADVQ